MAQTDNRLTIYQKYITLIYYSKNLLNKFPKSEKFDLCTDIKSNLYEILKQIIYAWKEFDNKKRYSLLREIDVNLIFLKTLIQISHRCKYITDQNFRVWNENIAEIGKMIGAWMKTCQKE